MSELEQKHEEYLGDGVYASFNGYHIILDARKISCPERRDIDGWLQSIVRYAAKHNITGACDIYSGTKDGRKTGDLFQLHFVDGGVVDMTLAT